MKEVENVLNEQRIQEWKNQWGKVYKTIIDDEAYVWRKLKRKEYVEIMGDKPEPGQESAKIYDRQERITRTVVLFPSNIDEVIEATAGLATTLADEAILKSGFDLLSTVEL